MIRRIIPLCTLTLALSAAPVAAQGIVSELNRQSVENATLTPAQLKQQKAERKAAISKAKKQAKTEEKNGFQPVPGYPDLTTQYTELYLREQKKLPNGLPAYIIERANIAGKTTDVAIQHARFRCRAAIVENLGQRITEELFSDFVQVDGFNVEQFATKVRGMVEGRLGRTEPVLHQVRKQDGLMEVTVAVACDKRAALTSIFSDMLVGELEEGVGKTAAETFVHKLLGE